MTTVPANSLNPVIFEVPEPPEEFGQDGGRFYRSYDQFAEEIDEDMTTGLKEQLDGLLIFAGLFAGINTAFLALTLPLLSSDPADDTNALLTQNNAILMQLAMGRNDSLPADSDLPSTSFSPAHDVLAVNVLFSLSLTFALISSFLAVLGRQWLVYYRKRGGGGPDLQRWEQLKRFLGAERWRLELILDDILPSLLQIGLIIFCVSLIIYLHSLNPTVSRIVGIPMYFGLAFIVGSALCTIWDRFCPFQSPLSHLLSSFVRLLAPMWRFAKDFWIIHRGLRYPIDVRRGARNRQAERTVWFKEAYTSLFSLEWLLLLLNIRKEDPLDSLQIIALRRLICTSEDPATLLSTAANIPTINDSQQLAKLWEDEIFRERLIDLYKGSADRTLKFLGRGKIDLASAVRRLYAAATLHFVCYIDLSLDDFVPVFNTLRETEGFKVSTIWIPQDVATDSSPFYLQMSLTLSLLSIFDLVPSEPAIQNFCTYLKMCADALETPNWRFLCSLCWTISQLPRIKDLSHLDIQQMRRVLRGECAAGLESITQALSILSHGKGVSTLDYGAVMTSLMRCTVQVLADECPHPTFKLEEMLTVLQCAEKVLRTKSVSIEVERAIEELRTEVVSKVVSSCFSSPQPDRREANISEEVFKAVILLFLSLRDPNSRSRFSYSADVMAMHTYAPLVDEFLSEEVSIKWEDAFYAVEDCPALLRPWFDAVEGSWAEFTTDIKERRMMQREERHRRQPRDPEGRWCHWQEDLRPV